MKTSKLNLLIPDKTDVERDAVAESFARCGGSVHRIGRFWEPPPFDPETVRVYGPYTFSLGLQQKLGFALCSPDDELVLRVPSEFLKRGVTRRTLGEASSLRFPCFVKPVTPKQFRAALYRSSDELTAECRGLGPDTAVLVSEPVTFAAEARSFVMDGQVLDIAVYEGTEETSGAEVFVEALIQAVPLPRAVVVDVGFIADRGWAVIEFNASWGAGLNGCNSDEVLPAIVAASGL